MRGKMDMMNGRMDQPLYVMMVMAKKEDNLQIIVDAKNIASHLGSSSLHIPELNNPKFGLPLSTLLLRE